MLGVPKATTHNLIIKTDKTYNASSYLLFAKPLISSKSHALKLYQVSLLLNPSFTDFASSILLLFLSAFCSKISRTSDNCNQWHFFKAIY